MSASIYWRPVAKSRKSIDVSAPSNFMAAMTKAFGEFPCKLSETDLPILRGMAAVNYFPPELSNPFEQIINAIDQVGSVEVWGEY